MNGFITWRGMNIKTNKFVTKEILTEIGNQLPFHKDGRLFVHYCQGVPLKIVRTICCASDNKEDIGKDYKDFYGGV